jgi:hypothetical protein
VGLTSQKVYVFPANYTVYTPEHGLKYFTEDPGLNAFYASFYYNYAPFFNGTEYGVTYDRRGELIYNLHQQLLARYSLERLSHDLPDVEPYYYGNPFQVGPSTTSLKVLSRQQSGGGCRYWLSILNLGVRLR